MLTRVVFDGYDGSTVSLSAFAGRPLVINLWATWCPPCHREMPVLAAAQRARPEIQFVFVNQGESAEVVARYLAANGLRLSNVVLDPARQTAKTTGSSGYPTTLFYDARGRLRKRHMGELSHATLGGFDTVRFATELLPLLSDRDAG